MSLRDNRGAALDGGGFDDYAAGDAVDGGGFGPDQTNDALARMRAFLASYPNAGALASLTLDYADKVPDCAGLFPGGLVEIRRRSFIDGTCEVESQYNFALYVVLPKAPGDDAGATLNAEWLMDFQEWVQAQSVRRLAPTFGDEPRTETMSAHSGGLYSAQDEGTAVYAVQISARFRRFYGRD